MNTKALILATTFIASVVFADNRTLLQSAEHLGNFPSALTWGFSLDQNNQFNGIESYGQLPSFTWDQVKANTNSAEFAAWIDSRNADATDDQALAQETQAALVAAIADAWPDVTFTGSKKQVRTLTRRLAQEHRAARQIAADSSKTPTERLDAIADLEKLKAIQGQWTALELMKRK